MALKPTIYKCKLTIADLNNDAYVDIASTIALHPSETVERMMARVLAFCLHVHQDPDQRMTFTKGLSAIDEPDIWLREMNDTLTLSIDVGEPSHERIKKLSRQANTTLVYSFNSKSDVWWSQNQTAFAGLPVEVRRFNWSQICDLASAVARTMEWTVTISGDTLYVATADNQHELTWQSLST